MYQSKPLLLSRRFAPLFWCQFFSAFSDNFLKNALACLIVFHIGGSLAEPLTQLAAAVFIAPYFILSALGGQIADRFDKAIIAQRLLESTDGAQRFPATEIMVVTSLLRKLLMEDKVSEIVKAIEQGQYYGMHSFDQDIIRLFNEKRISKEEALEASSNPDDFMVKMNTLRLGDM